MNIDEQRHFDQLTQYAVATLSSKSATQMVVDRSSTGEFWTIAFSRRHGDIFIRLVEKYYPDQSSEDVTACIATCKSLAPLGIFFLVASLRKKGKK